MLGGQSMIPTALAAQGPNLSFFLRLPPPKLAMLQGLKKKEVEARCKYAEVEALRQVRTSVWILLTGSHIEQRYFLCPS